MDSHDNHHPSMSTQQPEPLGKKIDRGVQLVIGLVLLTWQGRASIEGLITGHLILATKPTFQNYFEIQRAISPIGYWFFLSIFAFAGAAGLFMVIGAIRGFRRKN